MKKQLLSIGLSLAVLGGSAVTAIPAVASTTNNTVTKQQAQKQITQLQASNKKLEERLKLLVLYRADTMYNVTDKNDKIAVNAYFKYSSAKRSADYATCEVNAIKQVTKKINDQVSKGNISKSYAKQIAEKQKSSLSRAQNNVIRHTGEYKSHFIIAKYHEGLGKTWKIERPFHEHFDKRKITNKENCLQLESRTYGKLKNESLKGSSKDKSSVKSIVDNYRKGQYISTKNKIQNEKTALFHQTHAQNAFVKANERIVKDQISLNDKKIEQLKRVK